MAKLLSEIQTGAGYNLGDTSLDITTDATGLITFNRVYRALSGALPWPELRRQDTSLTTVAKQETYDWPTNEVYLNIQSVEIQDSEDNNYYKLVFPPADESSWADALTAPAQPVPDLYLRYSVLDGATVTHKVAFRPVPKYASTVRITGIVEPRELIGAADATVFLSRAADDALEHLIAAIWAEHDGDAAVAQQQTARAAQILGTMFGKDQFPAELIKTLIGG